jgi:hypothetical protein
MRRDAVQTEAYNFPPPYPLYISMRWQHKKNNFLAFEAQSESLDECSCGIASENRVSNYLEHVQSHFHSSPLSV